MLPTAQGRTHCHSGKDDKSPSPGRGHPWPPYPHVSKSSNEALGWGLLMATRPCQAPGKAAARALGPRLNRAPHSQGPDGLPTKCTAHFQVPAQPTDARATNSPLSTTAKQYLPKTWADDTHRPCPPILHPSLRTLLHTALGPSQPVRPR